MGNRLSMAEAARMLVATGKLTDRRARKVLIAALIEEQLVAVCDAYWRDSIPAVSGIQRSKNEHVQDDATVPSDFWRLEHAHHFEGGPNDRYIPSGSWGSWSRSGFTTEIEVTGYAAANRYPDFRELECQGSKPVSLSWTAVGVSLHEIDVQAIIDRRGFNALIKRAERTAAVRWGNTTKSDALRVIARFCAMLMALKEKEECERDPGQLLRVLQRVTANASEEAAVSDKVLRNFAKMVAEEAGQLAWQEREIPPT